MRRKPGVKKGRKIARGGAARGRIARLKASADESKRSQALIGELGSLYRPIKKPVTLRLDADVLAWFKKPGPGYQTRINRALRSLMRKAGKESRE